MKCRSEDLQTSLGDSPDTSLCTLQYTAHVETPFVGLLVSKTVKEMNNQQRNTKEGNTLKGDNEYL